MHCKSNDDFKDDNDDDQHQEWHQAARDYQGTQNVHLVSLHILTKEELSTLYKCDIEATKKAQTETLFYLSRSRKVPEQTYIHEAASLVKLLHVHTCIHVTVFSLSRTSTDRNANRKGPS